MNPIASMCVAWIWLLSAVAPGAAEPAAKAGSPAAAEPVFTKVFAGKEAGYEAYLLPRAPPFAPGRFGTDEKGHR